MTLQNIFSAIPNELAHEVFETLIENGTIKIERIISKGQQSPWYDQEKNEWVMVLKGRAMLSFDDDTSALLQEGDFINIPSRKRHRVSWTDPDQETIWLAIHY
ncbi:MAG: cupin domain-containing protein [Nitrosomonas sp.]|nr:MAG: cupin domain-containing protein [Nitrosomonas sp.]